MFKDLTNKKIGRLTVLRFFKKEKIKGMNRIRRRNKWLCQCEWSEKTGLKQDTIRARLNHGWNIRNVLTLPLYKRRVYHVFSI